MKVLGMMSGTSLDGIDYCLSDISINNKYNFNFDIIDCKTYSYTEKIKNDLNKIIFNNSNNLHKCNDRIGRFYKETCLDFLKFKTIDLVALHGQTISHKDKKYSIQIGNPFYLKSALNVPIYYDFRSNDIANGGSGAPLMPFLDWLLFKNIQNKITISLNIGGISNLSIIKSNSKKSDIKGFDIGPGMTLIDKFVKSSWRLDYDFNGRIAQKGNINSSIVNYISKNDLVLNSSKKVSLSTEQYSWDFVDKINNKFIEESKYDVLRSIVSYTAKNIIKSIDAILKENNYCSVQLLISGGGAKNYCLINEIKNKLKNIDVKKLNYRGLNIDNKEAFLMGVLGASSYLKISNNVPSVTGANKNLICGKLYE